MDNHERFLLAQASLGLDQLQVELHPDSQYPTPTPEETRRRILKIQDYLRLIEQGREAEPELDAKVTARHAPLCELSVEQLEARIKELREENTSLGDEADEIFNRYGDGCANEDLDSFWTEAPGDILEYHKSLWSRIEDNDKRIEEIKKYIRRAGRKK